MRIFISAGEPSGDLHGANLVRALRGRHPGLECVGFGGEHMADAGCRLLYPLCRLAVMWFLRVLSNAPTFLHLLSRADRYFRHQRPDAVVLIDYPGFNWWIARRAKFHGIPVFYFVPPQLWAWAGWRVNKMRRFVDHVLCSLPFEEKWYRERGVQAHHLGHPFFDELPQQRLDADFLAEQQRAPEQIIGLLPGSRTQELERNLSTLVRAARTIHQARPDTRFLVACFRPSHQDMVEAYLRHHARPAGQAGPAFETCVGRTAEIIELASACVAVSGSVSLELLWRCKPSVILYRIRPVDLWVARRFIKTPFICLVNLLADQEVFPEFLTNRCEATAIAERVLEWLNQPEKHLAAQAQLAALKKRVAKPGACQRAAEFVLREIDARRIIRRAG